MSAVSWSPYEEHFVLRFMAPSPAYNIAFPTFSAEREVEQLIRNVLSNKRVTGKTAF